MYCPGADRLWKVTRRYKFFSVCIVQVQLTSSSSTCLFILPSFNKAFLIGQGAVSMNLSMRLLSSLEKAVPIFGANWSAASSSSPCIGSGMETGLPRCLLATTGTKRPGRLFGAFCAGTSGRIGRGRVRGVGRRLVVLEKSEDRMPPPWLLLGGPCSTTGGRLMFCWGGSRTVMGREPATCTLSTGEGNKLLRLKLPDSSFSSSTKSGTSGLPAHHCS